VLTRLGAAFHGLAKAVFPGFRPGFVTEDAWVGLVALIVAGFAAAAAYWLGRCGAAMSPVWTAVVLLAPVTAGLLYADLDTQRWYRGNDVAYMSLVNGILMWAAGIALVVIAAAALRRRAHHRWAWTVGTAGAVVVLAVFAPGQQNFSYLTYMMICSGYAVGYAIGAARERVGAGHPGPAPATGTDVKALQHA
jgi:hypothetical protein